MKISNPNRSRYCNTKIVDNGYNRSPVSKKIAAGGKETIVSDLEKSFEWYDFSVSINENSYFAKHYAGRIETGKEGYSNPVMKKISI